ncbi:DUF2637 domain-containing protein [Actinomadura sp. NEAU-AAG7]|uniref:DUF2637 domain-containing protein n=1 Tax=Actinomadura sp. NEAU-AAG7 TaxID=2839640 RepID=UPI001BE44303|nr:DUF2637 domain-containing protein [Actinomadura sp. NEAU-AAG7]MBT2206875.1 DUF2637 domain-containing protein [Actinomadura sp. NEAU-AAG7]
MTAMDEDTTAGHGPPVPPLTWAQRILAVIGGVFFAGLAGLGGYGSYASVRDVAEPWFGGHAWIVPAGVDLGILALVSVALLLEWLAMPMPALRWMAMAFTGATVWLNVSAAHGDPAGVVMHAAMPVLFVTFVEAVRHAIRRRAGIAAGTVREGVPLARWLLAPISTFRMWRRMVLWQITSYPRALTAEQRRRRALALLRDHYGRAWKNKAPADVVWMLSDGVMLDQALARVTELTTPTPGPPAGTALEEAPPVGTALGGALPEVTGAASAEEPSTLTKAQASDTPGEETSIAPGRAAGGRAPRPAPARPAAERPRNQSAHGQPHDPGAPAEPRSTAVSAPEGDRVAAPELRDPVVPARQRPPAAAAQPGSPAVQPHLPAASAQPREPAAPVRQRGPAAAAQARGSGAPRRGLTSATAGTEARAQIILAADPNITGAELGRRLNLSPRQGQRLLSRLSRPAPSSAVS